MVMASKKPLKLRRPPLHHVLLNYSDEPPRTEHQMRHSDVRVHAPSHRAVRGTLHHHQGQKHVAGRFHLLLRSYHPSPCRGRPEPFARCAQGGRDTYCTHYRTHGPRADKTQGVKYEGVRFEGKICGVSILRAGEVCFPT
jgi:hypothetical protein